MIKSLPCDRIREVFSALCNEECDSELFINSAAESILCRVKKSADPERWIKPLCYAAGCLAYYRFCLSKTESDISDYKVGDITVKTNTTQSILIAERLWQNALEDIGDALTSSFAFISV